MSRRTPRWRQVFDKVERTVGRPLEDVANSGRFVDVMAVTMKARRAVTGTAGRVVGGAVGKVLRTANIATRDDMQRLTGHLAALASEIRANNSAGQVSGARIDTDGLGGSAPDRAAINKAALDKSALDKSALDKSALDTAAIAAAKADEPATTYPDSDLHG